MTADLPGFNWHLPVQVRFGEGCSRDIPEALQGRPAVVLAFTGTVADELHHAWAQALGTRLLAWVTVTDGLSSVARCRELAARVWPLLQREPQAVLIGVGGGTTLDLAKVLRCRPKDAVDGAGFDAVGAAIRGEAAWPALALSPLWMMPTTAGTGSEVTRWATVWDTDAAPAMKRSFDEPFGYAERAWVDPALTRTCPLGVVRDTALDTLAHALEALWNRHANPASDALALSAARRVITCLPQRLAQPGDAALRRALSLAALEAGMAFSQTRTALAHALSYALTLEQGVPHGAACAVWLPAVWKLAAGRDLRLDAALADLAALLHRTEAKAAASARPRGTKGAGHDDGSTNLGLTDHALAGAASLQRWLRRLGAAADPRELGIDDGEDRLRGALDSPRGRNFVATAAR
jgi:phosphonate metabolism-associated iron-containing alcohol dehydrogenase